MNKPENGRHDRMPCVAGTFYPEGAETLTNELITYFSSVGNITKYPHVRAIISPHAGYVYSGIVAASAFSAIPSGHIYENIILIGSSHRVSFSGASVYNAGDYVTPLGKMKVNRKIADKLISKSEHFSFMPEAHLNEHCLEVQLPFIQHYFSNQPEIIPIIIGSSEYRIIREISLSLKPLFHPENLFIISTDFSHFPSWSDAMTIDSETREAILSGSPGRLIEVLQRHERSAVKGLATSMCGWTAGLTLMYLTEDLPDLEYVHLMYRNSGDIWQGDKSRVVGYHSFAIREKKDKPRSDDFLNKQEEKELIFIARRAIEAGLGIADDETDFMSTPEALRKPYGVFVSLHIGDELRGCIGTVSTNRPLCESVDKMARAAAFNDPRFPPLSKKEYENSTLEISILTPLNKIRDINEIVIGTHGLLIRKGNRSGVMLPQVATERGWSVNQFLEHTADSKAGIGKDGWKDAEIFVFKAKIINDDI
jgi:AmmeMemoRadiSam system protein B/AmmeMemoRadiSam system protein A